MEANQSGNLRTEVVRRLLWLSRKHYQLHDAQMQKIGFRGGQVPILMALHRHGALTQVELAQHAHVTPATISGTLKRMEKAGSIRREGIKEDARVSLVHLTDAGKIDANEVLRVFHCVDRDILEGFTEEECREFNGYLMRMQENALSMLDHPNDYQRREDLEERP